VWDIVGSDCLTDDYGKPDESMSMSRDEVFEIAGDRIDIYGELTLEEVKEFYERDRSKDETLKKEAFPYERYGW